jgi:hypothetical protein
MPLIKACQAPRRQVGGFFLPFFSKSFKLVMIPVRGGWLLLYYGTYALSFGAVKTRLVDAVWGHRNP